MTSLLWLACNVDLLEMRIRWRLCIKWSAGERSSVVVMIVDVGSDGGGLGVHT